MSPAEAHECHLWSSQRQKLRKRDGVHVSKGSDDFCFWTLEKCFLLDHPVCCLKRGDFVGSQLQRVSKVSPSVWQLCRATRGIHVEDGQLVSCLLSELGPVTVTGVLLQVPAQLGLLLLLSNVAIPACALDPPDSAVEPPLASTEVAARPEPPDAVVSRRRPPAAGPEGGGGGDDEAAPAAVAARQPVSTVQLSPMQEIHMLRLNFALQNAADLPVAVNSVIRFLAPVTGDFDPVLLEKAMASVPGRHKARSGMLKLDMLQMLWRRHCMAESVRKHKRVARFLSMDASPQGAYEYLAMTEEIMEREQPVRVPDSPWDGFECVLRTLPIMTLALGEARTFVKAQRLKHALCLENSSQHVDTYRTQVKGWVSDQGTEKAVPGFPFGSPATLQDVTSRLRGAATLQGLVASSKEGFLWNSF